MIFFITEFFSPAGQRFREDGFQWPRDLLLSGGFTDEIRGDITAA
jgi:hypothetical protein